MSKTEDPAESQLSLTLVTESPSWKQQIPDIDELSQQVILSTLKVLNLSAKQIEVSVVLADDEFIRGYNRQYRSIDRATNVLSFSALDEAQVVNDNDNLGDIMMAFTTVEREAGEQSKPFVHHYMHLLIHGVLHLLGYDHETDKEAEEMESLEIKILGQLGVSDPYKLSA